MNGLEGKIKVPLYGNKSSTLIKWEVHHTSTLIKWEVYHISI